MDRRPSGASGDEHTPSESTVEDASLAPVVAGEVEAREAATPDAPETGPVNFDTVPGGGMNRLSGGRAAARAYVRPKTPAPEPSFHGQTISIDVESHAGTEGRSFRTSPSLARRRVKEQQLDSIPPLPPSRRGSRWPWLAAGILALAALGALVLLWRGAPPAPSPSQAASRAAPPAPVVPAAAPPAKLIQPSEPAPSSPPTHATAAVGSAAPLAPPPTTAESAVAPAVTKSRTESSERPKGKSAAPTTTAESDPWLE